MTSQAKHKARGETCQGTPWAKRSSELVHQRSTAGNAELGSERGRKMYSDEAAARCAATKELTGGDDVTELVAGSSGATTSSLKLTYH